MSDKRIAAGLWLALLLGFIASCSTVDASVDEDFPVTPGSSGVEGHVWIGPSCPIARAGTECPDEPYETEFEITDVKGKVVEQVKSDEEGFFRIVLPPGSYILVPVIPEQGMPPHTEPIPFTVEAGSFTQIEVTFDSGLR